VRQRQQSLVQELSSTVQALSAERAQLLSELSGLRNMVATIERTVAGVVAPTTANPELLARQPALDLADPQLATPCAGQQQACQPVSSQRSNGLEETWLSHKQACSPCSGQQAQDWHMPASRSSSPFLVPQESCRQLQAHRYPTRPLRVQHTSAHQVPAGTRQWSAPVPVVPAPTQLKELGELLSQLLRAQSAPQHLQPVARESTLVPFAEPDKHRALSGTMSSAHVARVLYAMIIPLLRTRAAATDKGEHLLQAGLHAAIRA
jgi:hypothetical protein